MSDTTVIRYLLVNSAALTAIVPPERILQGEIKQGTSKPAIGISHISGVWGKEVSGQSRFCRARVQVTVEAASYGQKKQIMRLVREAVPRTPGLTAGVAVDSILRDADGADIDDTEVEIYIQTQDFFVSYNE